MYLVAHQTSASIANRGSQRRSQVSSLDCPDLAFLKLPPDEADCCLCLSRKILCRHFPDISLQTKEYASAHALAGRRNIAFVDLLMRCLSASWPAVRLPSISHGSQRVLAEL